MKEKEDITITTFKQAVDLIDKMMEKRDKVIDKIGENISHINTELALINQKIGDRSDKCDEKHEAIRKSIEDIETPTPNPVAPVTEKDDVKGLLWEIIRNFLIKFGWIPAVIILWIIISHLPEMWGFLKILLKVS